MSLSGGCGSRYEPEKPWEVESDRDRLRERVKELLSERDTARAEYAKLQETCQEQVDDVRAILRKVAAERDEALKRVAKLEAQPFAMSDIPSRDHLLWAAELLTEKFQETTHRRSMARSVASFLNILAERKP